MLKSIGKRMKKTETENTNESKNKTLKIVLTLECTLAVCLVAVLVLHSLGVIKTKADKAEKQEAYATTRQQASQSLEKANSGLFNMYAGFLKGTFQTENGEVFEFTPGDTTAKGSFKGYITKDMQDGTGNYEVTTDGGSYYVTISSGSASSEYIYTLEDGGKILLVNKENGDPFTLE